MSPTLFTIGTALLLLSLVGLVGPAMLLAFERALPRKVEGLREVTKGSALMVLACLTLAMNDYVDLRSSIYLGSLLLTGACIYWYEGARKLANVPGDPKYARFAMAGYSVGLGGFTFFAHAPAAILAYNAIACAASLGACSIVISRGQIGKTARHAVGMVFLIGVALFAAQAAGLIQYIFGIMRMPLEIGALLIIGIYFTAQAAMIGFAVMASERVNSEFERDATLDYLTGLLLRGEFVRRADSEMTRCARNKAPVACLMMDIDHFKLINDQFGHPAGDKVIADFSARIKCTCRPYDLVGRYGGEEFVAILPGTSPQDARAIAQRIRLTTQFTGPDLPQYTVSIGVCCASQVGLHDMISHADKALYRAKQDGRNRVCSEPIFVVEDQVVSKHSTPLGTPFNSLTTISTTMQT